MAVNYEILSAFALATALLSISPGPDNLFVLTQSMVYGKKFGLATTAGLMTGCLVHTTLLALGVSALIKARPNLYMFIKFFGAMYLFYLAYRVMSGKESLPIGPVSTPKKGLWQLYRQGFVMNVLNPKVTIFFLAFFPGFLFSDTLGLVWQFYILGGVFILVSFSVFGCFVLLADAISIHMRGGSGRASIVKWLQVVVFLGIGIYLLLSRN